MLRFACGTQRQQGYARLQAAITDGDVSTAASVAQARYTPYPHPWPHTSATHTSATHLNHTP